MTDFGEGNKPPVSILDKPLGSHVTAMGSMRERVGDPSFDPSKPSIAPEKSSELSAQSIINDTNRTFSAIEQTHHKDRLENLMDTNTERVKLLFNALDAGEISRAQLQETLGRMLALTDLSGIVDPMTFTERPDRKQWVFDNAVRKAKKFGKQIYVTELDVSGFKGINDSPKHGHLVGDEFLRKIGTFLTKASYEPIPKDVNQPDSATEKTESPNSFNIIRLGGDEFLVVEVGDEDEDLTRHKKLIDETPAKMREICSELGISYDEHPVVFHSGVTVMGLEQKPEEAIKAADQELIKSKASYYEQNPKLNRRVT